MPISSEKIDALARSLECDPKDFRTLSLAALMAERAVFDSRIVTLNI